MSRRLPLVALLATLVALTVASAASARDDYVYGPTPDWTRYKALAEPAIRAKIDQAKLADPPNWSIVWPNGYAKLGWRHKGRFQGYFTCGYLQPIAAVDGRYARINFVVVIDRDVVQTVDISSRESNSLVNVMCQSLVSQGILPPASLMGPPPAAAGTTDAPKAADNKAVGTFGLTIKPMPEGAYVIAVSAGSSAERAGLAPGMVIASVNGIPLAGLREAMKALLAADSPTLSLETVTGQRIALRKSP